MSQAEKLKLMVVDDEPDNLDLLVRTFRKDYQIFRADGATSALKILDTEGEMAIIISDQRMPLMNGTEFLSKTVDRFPDTIRILLTGYTDVDDLVEAINSGKVFKYITKPWNPEDVKEIVKQASDTYRVLKKRTNELNRAVRRESLLNSVTTAIRESLDYSSSLETIVTTIGKTFAAKRCILRPVDNLQLMGEYFSYQAEESPEGEAISGEDLDPIVENVLQHHKAQICQNIEDGDRYTHLVVPLIWQQQILGVLSLYQAETEKPWTKEDIDLINAVSSQAALAIFQAKLYQRIQLQAQQMQDELEVARQIQNNLLRQSLPDVEGIKLQAHCYAARQVGGDFFEVYLHPQGDIWLAVGDVSGKGVPAALFMASGISILRRELAQEISPEPEVVMRNLNSIMSDDLFSTNCFITMVLARYTPESRQLVYANAGHVYPLVWSHPLVIEQQTFGETSPTVTPNYMSTRGVPLGILRTWTGAAGTLTLDRGDILLLISDGITEATVKGSSSMLGTLGLWQLILQESAPFNLTNLLTRIRGCTNNIQEDDQTILSLEVC